MGATYSQARAADAQMPRSDKSEVLGVDVSSTKATLDISSFRQATLGITAVGVDCYIVFGTSSSADVSTTANTGATSGIFIPSGQTRHYVYTYQDITHIAVKCASGTGRLVVEKG